MEIIVEMLIIIIQIKIVEMLIIIINKNNEDIDTRNGQDTSGMSRAGNSNN